MRVLVTGATGLIGRALCARLERAVVLSREPDRAKQRLGPVEAYLWAPEHGPPPAQALGGLDVVYHLAGEPIADRRWTAEQKRRLRDSRVHATRNLVAGLEALAQRPRALVSASAVGFYGERGEQELDETSERGDGFLAELCADWEREALSAERLGVRVACVRTGLVLAGQGGALARLLPLFRLGLGGKLGSGEQWLPWVALDDVVGLLLHAGSDDAVRGAINAVGPRPVRNATFTVALAHALHRPALLRVPAAALRLALGELSELLTASQHVLPRVAERTGYRFRHAELASALAAALRAG